MEATGDTVASVVSIYGSQRSVVELIYISLSAYLTVYLFDPLARFLPKETVV